MLEREQGLLVGEGRDLMLRFLSLSWPRVASSLGFGLGVICIFLALRSPVGAADESTRRMEDCLRTGEFGTALQVARGLSDVDLRDRWLGRIAQRQADVGARQASLSTLSDIQGDLARRDALQTLADRPLGARGGAAMADFDTLIESHHFDRVARQLG